MTEPNILVLLAAYNGAQHIEEQLRSILDQNDVKVQIVVRVDPSTDETSTTIEKHTQSDGRVTRSIADPHSEATGAAANFYRLIRSVDVPPDVTHIAFADQDDVWYPHKLQRAVAVMTQSRAAGYSSDVDTWDTHTNKKRPLIKSQPQTHLDHLFSSAGPGCTYVLERDAFLDFQRGIQSHFTDALRIDYHDWLAYAWIRQAGLPWVIDPARTMAYRQHESNQIGANNGARAALRRFNDIRNGWYLDQVLRIASFIGADDQQLIRELNQPSLKTIATLLKNTYALRRRKVDAAIAAAMLSVSTGQSLIAERR